MAATSEISIYELLLAGADPRERSSGFPSIDLGSEQGGVRATLPPGLQDAVLEHGTSDLRAVATALQLLVRGEQDASEALLRRLRFVDNIDELMANIDEPQLAAIALPAFELLRCTRSYEVAKWTTLLAHIGSAISTGLDDDEVDRLALLARHAELTAVVTVLLSIASDREPGRLRTIIELAPYVSGWGLADLIGRRQRYMELHDDPELDRLLLVNVARNADGIDPDLALPLVSTIGLAPWVERALAQEDDISLREAVAWLLRTLLAHPDPHGGIDDVDGGRELLERWAEHTALRAEVVMGERRTLAVAARDIEAGSPQQAARWIDGALLDLDMQSLMQRASTEDWAAIELVALLQPPEMVSAARGLLRRGQLNAWVIELVRQAGDDSMRLDFVRHALRSRDGYIRQEAVTAVHRSVGLLADHDVEVAVRAIAVRDPAIELRTDARLALFAGGKATSWERLTWRRGLHRALRG